MGGTRLIMHMKTVMFKRTAATLGLMSLLSIPSTLMIPSSSHAATFFDTDFETCATGTGNDFPCEGWNDFGQERENYLEASTALAFSGTKAVKGTFDSNTGDGNTLRPSIYRTWTPTNHIFVRFATRESPGFQICWNGHTKMVRLKDDSGYPLLWIHNRYGAYNLIMEGPYDRAGGWVLSSGVAPSQTSWDEIEVEYRLNDPGVANGFMRMWINGTLRIEHLNHEYIGPTPTSVGPHGLSNPSTVRIRTAQIYMQCALGVKYYDRFAVGDTRIGPTQSKPKSADSTPPASPLGLRAY